MTKQKLAYSYMRSRIDSGDLSPGQRIVVNRIAEAIGTSAIPVREALLQLQAEGMVEITPHVGAIVASASLAEVLGTMETSAILEGYATRLALPRGREVTKALQVTNDRMRAAADNEDWAQFSKTNREFHLAIYSVCENSVLVDMINASLAQYDSLHKRTVFFQIPGRGGSSAKEHAQIIRLLGNSKTDPDELERVARDHKLRTLRAFASHFEVIGLHVPKREANRDTNH